MPRSSRVPRPHGWGIVLSAMAKNLLTIDEVAVRLGLHRQDVLAVICIVLLFGCYASHEDFVDAEVDGRLDVVHDAGAEADVADGGVVACAGGWYDPTSGLCWEDPPLEEWTNWWDADTYCVGLSLGGYGPGSWRLPTINELRSLIRGCRATETGGACGVTEPCLDWTCWSAPCGGCPFFSGPGAGGCYWDAAFGGTCGWYWSSSFYTRGAAYACFVGFHYGVVSTSVKENPYYVRCVRPGP